MEPDYVWPMVSVKQEFQVFSHQPSLKLKKTQQFRFNLFSSGKLEASQKNSSSQLNIMNLIHNCGIHKIWCVQSRGFSFSIIEQQLSWGQKKKQYKNNRSLLVHCMCNKNKNGITYSVFFLSCFYGEWVFFWVLGWIFEIFSMKNENWLARHEKNHPNPHISRWEMLP